MADDVSVACQTKLLRMFLASLRALSSQHARLAGQLARDSHWIEPAKLLAVNVAGKGIGLRLHQHAAAGETLLTVPAAIWSLFSAEAAVKNARSQAAGFVERLEQLSGSGQRSRLTEVVCLALQLLFERGRGDAFAASLPVPDVPLTWAPEELEELAGTRTHAAVLARHSFVRALHGSLFGAAESSPVSLEQLSWAMATITSRALSDSPSAPSMTLCPVLDLANHADEPSCQHGFDQDTQSFNLKAARDLPREADVCISYGAHLDNDRLLRQYGFTQPQNANDFSNIPPPWPPAPGADDPLAALKIQLLRRPDVQSSDSGKAWWNSEVDAQPVSVTGGHDAAPLLVVLRLMHLTPTDVDVGGGRVVDAHTAVDATRPLSPGNEAAARASLSAAARIALDAFPSTMEQTQEALARHAAGDTTLSTRKLHALRVRQGEQLALHGLLAACT